MSAGLVVDDDGICKGQYHANSPNPSPGTYMNNTGAAVCFDCPERYYCDGTRPSEYVECPVGRYCPAGTDASVSSCPAGEAGGVPIRARASI